MSTSTLIHDITDATFDAEVKQSSLPVLVDFWAPWCGPCKTLGPIIDELAKDYEGKLKVCKVNTDDNLQTAQSHRISGIPTLIIFKNGEAVEQMVGVHQKSALSQVIDRYL
ncbi:MAG: thioredoxin [Vampirovibrionales bacterium]|nr:thioredoxin [Vampirovibrionales bacterium]